ncbi:uncharacterized protein ARMOST_20536 [Armillaria ostoyae]|uniref:Uncharacterized protein n=1 Tax=Armillaria ostoyae TaxID=47428 RepID=A0A284S7L2_ARMOS|nr:uncharacterized protein ARMOST_20536 [Armillaria ostoyae]
MGYRFMRDVLRVHQRSRSIVYRVPYSPPVPSLAEDTAPILRFNEESQKLRHSQLDHHCFTCTFSLELDIIRGQAIILDFSLFAGHPRYQQITPNNPMSVSDEHTATRMWTHPPPLSGPLARS